MKPTPASLRGTAAAVLGALPWLNPFAAGPSPSVAPWLASMFCGLLLWMLAASPASRPHIPRSLFWSLIAVVLWAAVSQLSLRPEMVMLAGALVLVMLAAGSAQDPEIARGLQAGSSPPRWRAR